MPLYHVAVEWLHEIPSEPIHLYYELNADRCERRKVEEYRDGTMHSADASHGEGTTFLSWEPHPPQAEIEADPQFRVREMSAQAFESKWRRARQRERQPVTA